MPMFLVEVWEAYKEVTAVLGLLVLMLAVWKRRPILGFLWVSAVVQVKVLSVAVREAVKAWAASEGAWRKAATVILGPFMLTIVVAPVVVRQEMRLLATTCRRLRRINDALRD